MPTLEQLDHWLSLASQGLLLMMIVPLGMTLLRMLYGPSQPDRFVALDMLTALAVSIAALTTMVSGRREFMDVGMGLAFFGFVGACALAAFLEHQCEEKVDHHD